jgi:hypothetical protein
MRKFTMALPLVKNVCILSISLILAVTAEAQNMHEEQASMSGRVLKVSGSPYPAKVRVFQIFIRNGFTAMRPSCVTDTDLQGKFECSALPNGKFIVQVLPSRQSKSQTQKTPDSEGEAIPASIFYPGVTDLEDAMPISLHANEAGWADIRVVSAPTVEVTGELKDLYRLHPSN